VYVGSRLAAWENTQKLEHWEHAIFETGHGAPAETSSTISGEARRSAAVKQRSIERRIGEPKSRSSARRDVHVLNDLPR
jgi:hypothetical protein